MISITVRASRSYDVIIGRDILANIGVYLKTLKPACKAAIITDDKVGDLYLEAVSQSLQKEGYTVCSYQFANGEGSKTASTYLDIVQFLSQKGLHREDLVVALGGGVVGDIAGFAAGTYLRGIDFVQVPTTLLAAVDSSVGGKTGINLPIGKNLLGIFNQPIGVLYDINTVKTLSNADILGGLGECIKYAVLEGGELWDIMYGGITPNNIDRLIALCVACKKRIVESDEKETLGVRKLLNLGHTFGHAIEKLSNYEVTHGIAVVKGIAIIAAACHRGGILGSKDYALIQELIAKYGYNTACPFTPKDLVEVAKSDKKAQSKTLDLVVIKGIGKCALQNIDIDKLSEFIVC